MQNKEQKIEYEIDLRELFRTIWEKKIFILLFTSIVTLISIIYVSIKTTTYEVKALIEIGSYKNENINSQGVSLVQTLNLDEANNLSKILSTIFIDIRKNTQDKEFDVVNISVPKGMKNFIEVSVEAKSNDLAVKGLNEVVDYVKTEHKKILNDVKEKNELELKNIQFNISNIENDKIININKKIDLFNQSIVNLEEQLKLLNETLKNVNNLEPSIYGFKLTEKRDISNTIITNKLALYDFIEQKENLINIDINKLIERKKLLETLSLPHNLKNSEIVGSIIKSDNPVKPKKSLVVVFAFVTGFILSIFIVFFMQFINSIRKEDIK